MTRSDFEGWNEMIGEVPRSLNAQTAVRHDVQLEGGTPSQTKATKLHYFYLAQKPATVRFSANILSTSPTNQKPVTTVNN